MTELDSTTTPTEPQFKPQTYEEWKAAHGFKPAEPPRLEIGQRVKAIDHMWEDDRWLVEWNLDREPEYIPNGMLGTVTEPYGGHLYTVAFDNGITWAVVWMHDDLEMSEIEPVGKSPSELAHEASERERLAAYRQLTLFGEGGAS